MKKKHLLNLVLGLLIFNIPEPAPAALVGQGAVTYAGAERRLIYDTDLNVTWLDFSNSPGNFASQALWVNNLSINISGNSYENWRLPINPPSSQVVGYNVTNSEFGHLYYFELGNIKGNLNNTGIFQNLLPVWYTSGTEEGGNVWHFAFFDGWNTYGTKNYSSYYGIAVHEGKISAAPIPGAVWLLGSGIAGIATFRLKKKCKKVT